MHTSLFFVLAFSLLNLALAESITADSFQATNPPSYAIDNNWSTFWHSEYSPVLVPLPHQITIDLGTSQTLNGFTYLPRQDGGSNGNIGQYVLELSTDNKTWTTVANSTFIDDPSMKQVGFSNTLARYIRLIGITEAGNRGPWSSAAELGYYTAPNSTTLGEWGPMIALPLVPAAAFVEYETGNILTFASYRDNQFGGSGNTITAVYYPTTGAVSEANISNTGHDMFCPGMSLDFNGRAVVTGGDDADKTSIFTSEPDSWIAGPGMQIARGYQASATVSE